MANAYSDGVFTNALLVSNSVTYPFPWPLNSNTAQFELEYVQTSANYAPVALSSNSTDAPNAFLVEQGPVTTIAPGYIRFRRVYVQQPVNWSETRQIAYTFPGLSGPIGANINTWNPYYYRQTVTLFRNATVYHNYSVSANSPSLDGTFQVTDDGNVVDYIGVQNPNFGAGSTSPASEPANYTVSSDAQMIRGQIWEKISITVPKPV